MSKVALSGEIETSTTGGGFSPSDTTTVNSFVFVPSDTIILVLPTATAVTSPFSSTVAIELFAEVYVITTSSNSLTLFIIGSIYTVLLSLSPSVSVALCDCKPVSEDFSGSATLVKVMSLITALLFAVLNDMKKGLPASTTKVPV